MKLFLDLGANDSISARLFRKLYDPKIKYNIYSFEPEPIFANRFNDIEKCFFHQKAVWIEDCKLKFYRDPKDEIMMGGTLQVNKERVNEDFYTEVDAIDISKFIIDNFSKDDYIICKMDIEGAEYDVIPKMVEDESINYINELLIEWHNYKLKDFPIEKHIEVSNLVKHIPTRKWPKVPHEARRILGNRYFRKTINDVKKERGIYNVK